MKTAEQWKTEVQWIEREADHKGRIASMNYDTPTFIRYCEMQRDAADRDGQFDAATSIQHVIDDMTMAELERKIEEASEKTDAEFFAAVAEKDAYIESK